MVNRRTGLLLTLPPAIASVLCSAISDSYTISIPYLNRMKKMHEERI